jgi:hypothetical protein
MLHQGEKLTIKHSARGYVGVTGDRDDKGKDNSCTQL